MLFLGSSKGYRVDYELDGASHLVFAKIDVVVHLGGQITHHLITRNAKKFFAYYTNNIDAHIDFSNFSYVIVNVGNTRTDKSGLVISYLDNDKDNLRTYRLADDGTFVLNSENLVVVK